jgi:hypothetical protein
VLLLRREAAPNWPDIYPVAPYPPGHSARPAPSIADKAGYLATLESWDLAFVPEVLTDIRSVLDEAPAAPGARRRSMTSWSDRMGTWQACRLDLLLDCGERFLGEEGTAAAVRRTVLRYLPGVGGRMLRSRLGDPELLHYHRLCLDDLVPRLRRAGYVMEARLLALPRALVRWLDQRSGSQRSKPRGAAEAR